MENIFYLLGFAAGILITILIVFIISRIAKRVGGKIVFGCGKDGKDYDERQMLARGKAYEAGFFTMMAYIVFVGILADIMENRFMLSFGVLWIGASISIGVFVIICIVKDAYMSLRENAKGILIMLGSVGLFNLFTGLSNREHLVENVEITRKGQTFECIRLSADTTNLVVGILFFILMAVFVGKLWYDKKHEEEDSEE